MIPAVHISTPESRAKNSSPPSWSMRVARPATASQDQNIKKKVQAYCKYKGYDFNIDRPMEIAPDVKYYYADWKSEHEYESFIGDDDKAASVEYFTVYSRDKAKADKPF